MSSPMFRVPLNEVPPEDELLVPPQAATTTSAAAARTPAHRFGVRTSETNSSPPGEAFSPFSMRARLTCACIERILAAPGAVVERGTHTSGGQYHWSPWRRRRPG